MGVGYGRQVRLAMEEKFQEKDPENTTIVPTKVRAETPAAQEPVFAKVNLSPEPHTASGINKKFRDTLVWEGDGFLLLYKRLEVGTFK